MTPPSTRPSHSMLSWPALAGTTVRGRLTAVLLVLSGTAMLALCVLYFTTGQLLTDLTVRNEAVLKSAVAYAELSQALSDEETGVRGYVLTGDQAFAEPYVLGRARETAVLSVLGQASAASAGAAHAYVEVR